MVAPFAHAMVTPWINIKDQDCRLEYFVLSAAPSMTIARIAISSYRLKAARKAQSMTSGSPKSSPHSNAELRAKYPTMHSMANLANREESVRGSGILKNRILRLNLTVR